MDYRKRIEDLKNKQKVILEDMETAAISFENQTANHLSIELIPVTKKICQPQKEINKKLGESKLNDMILKINELASSLEDICRKEFHKETVWLHINWSKEKKYSHDPRKSSPWAPGERETNQHLGWSFIDVIDNLGKILKEYGFETNKSSGYEGYDVQNSSLYQEFSWNDEMKKIYKRYEELSHGLWGFEREIESLINEEPYKPTQDFWDNIK